jgi:hypothetical protein
LDIKDSLKEDMRFFNGRGFLMADWLVGCYCCCCWVKLEIRGNMGQCKSEHQDFKKIKERSWDSASLRTETLKGNVGQSKSNERDFKEQKRRL